VREHGEALATVEPIRRCEDSVEPGIASGRGHCLCDGVVVAEQMSFDDVEVRADALVGQVQDVQRDRHPAHAPADVERIDAVIDEGPEEFGPGRLPLAGSVPDARLSGPVVPARSPSGISARCHRMAGWALVPEADREVPAGCGRHRIGEVHT
jgi:hypothetical protein